MPLWSWILVTIMFVPAYFLFGEVLSGFFSVTGQSKTWLRVCAKKGLKTIFIGSLKNAPQKNVAKNLHIRFRFRRNRKNLSSQIELYCLVGSKIRLRSCLAQR